MKEVIKRQIISILFIAFILGTIGTVFFVKGTTSYALTSKSRTVRVAYPLQDGLTYIDENGEYCGYTYEYLEEIAQYTGWDYEFVQVEGDMNEQLITLMEMVENGEVDLMGATLYTEELVDQYDYASHSYGVAETVLQVPLEKADSIEINSQAMQTIRVAVRSLTGRMINEFEDYCKMNLIEPEYILCDYTEEQVDLIRNNEADVMLNTSLNYTKGVRTIARFSPKPFYFIMPKEEKTGLLAELNQAILDIEQADPYLTTTLFEKYFSPPLVTFQLTEAEQEYIDNSKPIRVGVLGQQPPFQYLTENDKTLAGISIDLLKLISEKTGLQFEFIYVDNSEKLSTLKENNEIEIVTGMPYQYEMAREENFSMTRPYVSAQYILVTEGKNTVENLDEKKLSLPNYMLYTKEDSGEITYFQNTAECFDAICDGEADYTYVDAYTAQYFINLPRYSKLKMIPQTFEERRVCYGVLKPGSRELLSILNKVIIKMPDEEIQTLVNKNTIVSQPNPINKVLQNAMYILSVLITLLLVAFGAYYISSRRSEKKLKSAKAQAEYAYDKAEKANLAKSEFLSRMSHEIRTPMNGISGMTAIAIRNIDDKTKVADCLEKVQMSSRHLLALINDILDMAKIESGKIEFHKESFDFNDFLQNLSGIYYGQAVEKGISYKTIVEGKVSEKLVGDSLRINQIIGNLLSNACKFTPAGGSVILRVSEISRDSNTIWIRFEVEDTGCGIASEKINQIFDSFEQIDTGISQTYNSGTGLGLAIVKRFTESMGGRVFVDSVVGHGSKFVVELPFLEAEQSNIDLTDDTEESSQKLKKELTTGIYNFNCCRFLLAEDNELNREIAMELLGETGALIETALNGTEAAELFSKSPVGYYDLIFMDIQMPVMNGYEATKKIRSLERDDAKTIPILAMTADAFAEDEEQCFAVGMNGHVSKPIDIDNVYTKIGEVLKKK